MKSTPRRGLEVYDFKDDDEFPDPVLKFSGKFKNPSRREDRRKSKDEFLRPGSKEPKVQAKSISSIPCVDVDEVDTDRCCTIAVSQSPLETIEENLVTKKGLKFDAATESKIISHEQQSDLDKSSSVPYAGVDAMDDDHCSDSGNGHSRLDPMEEDPAAERDSLEFDAVTESKCLSHEQHSKLDDNGCRNFLFETETGVSNAPSPSPQKSHIDCGLTVSPSNDDPVDVISDADESTSQSPGSPLSPIEVDDGSLGTYESGHCLGNFEMDNVNMTVVLYPDYVIYGDSYCTGAQLLTFSHSCIKISGLVLSGNDKTLSLEWEVDDLVNVECQWVQNDEFVKMNLLVLSKDENCVGDAVGIVGIDELKIGVAEPNWSQKQERIACLNDKYLAILNPVQMYNAIPRQTRNTLPKLQVHACQATSFFKQAKPCNLP